MRNVEVTIDHVATNADKSIELVVFTVLRDDGSHLEYEVRVPQPPPGSLADDVTPTPLTPEGA